MANTIKSAREKQQERLQAIVESCSLCLITSGLSVSTRAMTARSLEEILEYKNQDLTIRHTQTEMFTEIPRFRNSLCVWDKGVLVFCGKGEGSSKTPDIAVQTYIPGDWENRIIP